MAKKKQKTAIEKHFNPPKGREIKKSSLQTQEKINLYIKEFKPLRDAIRDAKTLQEKKL